MKTDVGWGFTVPPYVCMGDAMKYCNECRVTKNTSEFSKRKASKDGLQYKCKPCSVKIVMARRQTEEGKQIHRDAQYTYYRTPHGKAVHDKAYKK